MGCARPMVPCPLTCPLQPSLPGAPAAWCPPMPLHPWDPSNRSSLKNPKTTTFLLFSTPALKISSCCLGTGQEGISQHPARRGEGPQPGPLSASAMVFPLPCVRLPTRKLGASLGSPVPGLQGLLHDPVLEIRPRAQSCAQAAKFSIPHPAPPSLQRQHAETSLCLLHPPPRTPTTRRPGTSQPLAMICWRKASLKPQFQPRGCRSGPRGVSQPLPRPAEGRSGEKTGR